MEIAINIRDISQVLPRLYADDKITKSLYMNLSKFLLQEEKYIDAAIPLYKRRFLELDVQDLLLYLEYNKEYMNAPLYHSFMQNILSDNPVPFTMWLIKKRRVIYINQ